MEGQRRVREGGTKEGPGRERGGREGREGEERGGGTKDKEDGGRGRNGQ